LLRKATGLETAPAGKRRIGYGGTFRHGDNLHVAAQRVNKKGQPHQPVRPALPLPPCEILETIPAEDRLEGNARRFYKVVQGRVRLGKVSVRFSAEFMENRRAKKIGRLAKSLTSPSEVIAPVTDAG
jgi:hypothetical protein